MNPAKQLGIDKRVGSIDVGKDADLVLYDGHPLSVHAVVQKTFIDGDLYFDRETDEKRQLFIAGLKDRLLGKDKAGEEKGGKETNHASAGERSAPSPEVRWADEPYTCREDH